MGDRVLINSILLSDIEEQILKCIQCGSCFASCPLNDYMDHSPRKLFALLLDRDEQDVLTSNTPWFCVSCYQCMVRCPKEIPITNIMYQLKQLSIQHQSVPSSVKILDMYRAFEKAVFKRGRMTESWMMTEYGKHHPQDVLSRLPLALRLLKRNRLDLLPNATKGKKTMRFFLKSRQFQEH